MRRLVRIAVLLVAGAAFTACADEAPTTAPDDPLEPRLTVETADDLEGLFFFGPPVGEDEEPAADFDPTQLPVVVFEICRESDLDGADPLEDECSDPLGRWTSEGGPVGIGGEISLVRDRKDDWYQVDIPFEEFDRGDLELGTGYLGRVILGDPDEDVEIYGWFDFELVENQRERDPKADPTQVVWDRTLPVKWFLGEGATEGLVCETDVPCTAAVITVEAGGELCFPEEDCSSSEATAGVSIEEGALPHDIVLQIEDIDLVGDSDPLGIQNPQIEQAVNISATPPFDDLDAFDNDGDGDADIAVQLCYFVQDPDGYATYRGLDAGAERLPFDPRDNFIFDDANCDTSGPVAFLGSGSLGQIEAALRERVLGPAWRALGPRPLRAGDISFTADTRGFSPFVPALALDLAANDAPAPLVVEGETVSISVCVEGAHPLGADATQEDGVDVTFETTDGTLSAGNQQGPSVVVTSALEQPTGDCVNEASSGGQVAVARASWTVPGTAGQYSARAFLDEDYLVSRDDDLDGDQDNTTGDNIFELEDDVIEVEFATEAQAGIALQDVAPGSRHTCGVDATDTGLCWGQNEFGQLGDGGTTDSDIPVFVSGGSGFGDVSDWGNVQNGVDDQAHSCAVSDGDVWCWGYNAAGQLGDGTTDDSSTPVLVDKPSGVNDFVSVSVGHLFTCALDAGSRIWCWGSNTAGRLGNNDQNTSQSTDPVQVVSASLFDDVDAGTNHACALNKADEVWCWGANAFGQVGDGTMTNRFAPVFVTGGIANVSAGEIYTCAVDTSGGALCWGRNSSDQLGDGSGSDQTSPVQVQNPLGLSFGRVSAGGHQTCATAFTPGDSRPVAVCWGANFSGQLGNGSLSPSDEPVPVKGGLEFSSIEVGITHTCGISAHGGGAYCWGGNDDGQVGNGDTSVFPRLPTPVLPPPTLF